jgi:hypothetical protein
MHTPESKSPCFLITGRSWCDLKCFLIGFYMRCLTAHVETVSESVDLLVYCKDDMSLFISFFSLEIIIHSIQILL